MVDRDLAELYGVEPKRLGEQVKRNIERFPSEFRFQLSEKEKNELVAKCDRFKSLKHASSLPHVFTEQGVSIAFVNDLLKSAKNEVVLIDNYIDDTVFTLFSKYQNLKITIYTQSINKQLCLDFQKYNSQYKNIELKEFKKAHDRFLILDSKEVYHIGASLKDLGKKWFAFSRFEMDGLEILKRLRR